MDKIWYRNPSKSEVIGRCGGDEKTNDDAEPTKSQTLKKPRNILFHSFIAQSGIYIVKFKMSSSDCSVFAYEQFVKY